MAKTRGAVYPPPSDDLPPIAVIFYEDEVIGARAVNSIEAGDLYLTKMMQEFAGMIGHKEHKPKK